MTHADIDAGRIIVEIGIAPVRPAEFVIVGISHFSRHTPTELCEKTRQEAFELMLAHAQELGATAVVAIHYDATEVMAGVTEVLCYGTAVVTARA
jgi:uncharacterized protein YbjQ (UPF0145 family)